MAIPTIRPKTFEKEVQNSWKDDIESFDQKVYGLWYYITELAGNKFEVSEADENGYPINRKTCAQIFGNDPISISVMEEIINLEIKKQKIFIFQPHSNPNEQQFSEIQKIVNNNRRSKQLMAAGSNYTVVIGSIPEGVEIWVWDLRETKF